MVDVSDYQHVAEPDCDFFFKSAGEIMKKNRVTLILLKLVNVPNIF